MRYDAKAIGAGSEGAQTALQESFNKVSSQAQRMGVEGVWDIIRFVSHMWWEGIFDIIAVMSMPTPGEIRKQIFLTFCFYWNG